MRFTARRSPYILWTCIRVAADTFFQIVNFSIDRNFQVLDDFLFCSIIWNYAGKNSPFELSTTEILSMNMLQTGEYGRIMVQKPKHIDKKYIDTRVGSHIFSAALIQLRNALITSDRSAECIEFFNYLNWRQQNKMIQMKSNVPVSHQQYHRTHRLCFQQYFNQNGQCCQNVFTEMRENNIIQFKQRFILWTVNAVIYFSGSLTHQYDSVRSVLCKCHSTN